MRKALYLLAVVFCLLVLLALPVKAQGPVEGALATLAAATAQAQSTRAAQAVIATQVSSEATRQATIAQATRAALSAEATRTAQAQSAQATQSALDDLERQRALTAEAQSRDMAATSTRTALDLAEQEQLSRTYATRQDRFTFGLLVVEVLAILGACFVLWRVVRALVAWADHFRPRQESPLSGLIAESSKAGPVVIDVEPAPAGRMPDMVTVIDDPRMVEALDRWAERYDKEMGVNYDATNERDAESPNADGNGN